MASKALAHPTSTLRGLTYGCTADCSFCASQALVTEDHGLCVSSDVARCTELGGLRVEGDLFDERMGVSRFQQLCALRHRPMMWLGGGWCGWCGCRGWR